MVLLIFHRSAYTTERIIDVGQPTPSSHPQKTIMEAVTAMLSGGLQGGDVPHGKKDRDDKQTLLQTRISHNVKMEN